jgi:hypothetical protein
VAHLVVQMVAQITLRFLLAFRARETLVVLVCKQMAVLVVEVVEVLLDKMEPLAFLVLVVLEPQTTRLGLQQHPLVIW